jgi:hypothetical protein
MKSNTLISQLIAAIAKAFSLQLNISSFQLNPFYFSAKHFFSSEFQRAPGNYSHESLRVLLVVV